MNFSQVASLPKIDGLKIGKTVGKGSFAFVKSACLEIDPSTVIAVKFIHLPTCQKHGMKQEDVMREVTLQSRCGSHANVLKVIDCSLAEPFVWIAMELADGGDLFDKIEPDVGVDKEVAQFYYQQLVNAISYLHETCGVAHRDIKPENMLLDRDGNLKLADFGLASMFRRKDGSKRISRDQRGSLPYMAPEIIYCDGYYADITDIWSIGILVFVLLTGETPWELPHEEDLSFREFIKGEGKMSHGSWLKVDLVELNLLRKILQPDPGKRASLEILRTHTWYQTRLKFADRDGLCVDPPLLARKLLSKLKISLSDDDYLRSTQEIRVDKIATISSTQPLDFDAAHIEHASTDLNSGYAATQKLLTNTNAREKHFMTQEPLFSQRVNQDISSIQFSGNNIKITNFTSERLTKFYSLEDIEIILPDLELALQNCGIRIRNSLYTNFLQLRQLHGEDDVYPILIQLKFADKNGFLLSGTVVIMRLEDNLKSITFERKRGDPLEWRRLFKRIALFCRDIVFVN